MNASREELAELGEALETAIGLGGASDPPAPDAAWRERWPALAEIGLPAFCVPDEMGGLGMEVGAALVASRVLGAGLHGSPYPGIAAAAFALPRGLDDARRAKTCEAIVAGEELPALAFLDPASRLSEKSGGVHVDGRAHLVLGARELDALLLLPPDTDEMLLVPTREGCAIASADPFDVTRSIADVVLDGARATRLADGSGLRETTERLYGLLLAGDALGGAERTLERTRIHALEREAFGRPIGGFQAVQHRLVDHSVRVRGMTLLAREAAEALGAGRGDAARRALLAEAAVASDALHVLHDLLQLTGAIGFTWEHGLHLYERRAHLDARLGRGPRAALGALAALEGWTDAAAGSTPA